MKSTAHSNVSDWTLSDPWNDFCCDAQSLQRIAAKRGVGLTVEELAFTVFAGYLPAGTYEECLPYLPAAYDHLRMAAPSSRDCLPDLWTNLFHIWVPENVESLRRDGLLDGVVEQMRSIFHERLESWLSTGESIAMAANLELWCLDFLCSRLVAEDLRPCCKSCSRAVSMPAFSCCSCILSAAPHFRLCYQRKWIVISPRARCAAWCGNTFRNRSSWNFCVPCEQKSRHYLRKERRHLSKWNIGIFSSVGLRNG